jgi:hypothetical protein
VKLSIRAGALAAGLVMGLGVVVPLALPAGAAKASVSCAKETSPPLAAGKVHSTLATCTPAALKAGGTSVTKTAKNQTKGTVTDVITWKGGKGTTTAVIKYGPTTKGKCKAPFDARVKITGSVKSATGAAAKITKKGEPVTAFICAISNLKSPKVGQTTIEPGTKFAL